MAETSRASDLIDLVHHEHDHLNKLFDDIGTTFTKIARHELTEARRQAVVETARDDLEMAIDEMLHHFNQEEEVFFVEIEQRFPDLADDIAELADGHEVIGERSRWLHRQLKKPPADLAAGADEVVAVVTEVRRLLSEHTTRENQLFDRALEGMPAQERDALLDEMRRI